MTEEKRPSGKLNMLITVVALIGAAYHLISTQYLFQTFIEHQNNHIAFSLILIFLLSMKRHPRRWPLLLVLILLGLAGTGYVKIFIDAIQDRLGMPTTADLVIGIILVVVSLEAARQAFGPAIPTLALIFIAYDFFGHYLPDPFWHTRFPLTYIIGQLSIGLDGMYGTATAVSVNYIFLFFLFGGILQKSGAIEFFTALGKLAGKKLRGGPAQTAVVSSALVGTVTGSAVANVAITGAFTIPLMKRVGYKPEQAGAIEASASTGGQIMPPVMGAAAFLMSAITGIPYVDIMVAAVIPALLYFLAIGIYVEIQARALNVAPSEEAIDIKGMIKRMPCFVVPLALLTLLLIKGYTPMFCAFWSIVSLAGMNFITDYMIHGRLRLGNLVEGLTDGAIGGARIGVTSAVIGFLLSSMTMTGIGIKLSGMVAEWSHGVVFIACFITMLVSLLFGMGVPTMVAYALVAIMVAPALMKMGVPLLQAHFFCMFFAVFSNLTPPVAMAALVGAGIAGGRYFATAWMSFKISLIAFILPFLIVWNPALIMKPESLSIGVLTVISVLLALLCIAIVITSHYIVKVYALERILYLLCAAILLGYAFSANTAFFVVGVIMMFFLTFYQLRQGRAVSSNLTPSRKGREVKYMHVQ